MRELQLLAGIEMPEAESEMIRAALAGDNSALSALLSLHERPLLAFCLSMLGHQQDAEDAVQETLIRAIRGMRTFRHESSLRTWLLRIAANVCKDVAKRRPSTTSLADLPDCAGTASVERSVIADIALREALSRLPVHRRAVLLLREVEGWTVEEIAAAFGWNANRVYYEQRRAIKAIADWRGSEESR